MGGMEDEQQQTPVFIRRIYLMDLFRLFRLFPNRSVFCDPFADFRSGGLANWHFFCSQLLCDTPLDTYKPQIVGMLKKYHHEDEAEQLLGTFPESMHDVQYYLWYENYNAALELDPDNERALVGRARQRFADGAYEEAADDYARLLLLHPGKKSYMLNKAVCQLNMEEYEDALKLLYQLNYENADDVNVQRVLAWALTCDNKTEQAERIFQQLVDNGQATGEDYLNYGYCLWLLGRPEDAAGCFGEYFVREGNNPDCYANAYNRHWLHAHGISDIDISMMQMLAHHADAGPSK
jgi:tetratricopeptide (TPR) repeat protein